VLCPYCGKVHLHGGGELHNPIMYGSRGSHCGKGEYKIIPKD
jgi:hypothetical protein